MPEVMDFLSWALEQQSIAMQYTILLLVTLADPGRANMTLASPIRSVNGTWPPSHQRFFMGKLD